MSRRRKVDRHAVEAKPLPSTCATKQPSWLIPAICAGLVLVVIIVFGPTVFHGFINFDDNQYVYENRLVKEGLTVEGVTWASTSTFFNNWHPLTWLSYMLDCQIYGDSAGGFHLTNVLLHALNAAVLFLLLKGMTGRLGPSLFTAAVFAIHPLRVESVAWISERKDLLSGLFFLLTLAAYVRYTRHSFSITRYLIVVGLFALALMAKPIVVTLPFVLLLLDYWPLRRITAESVLPSEDGRAAMLTISEIAVPSRLIVEKLPFFGMSFFGCLVTLQAQKDVIEGNLHLSLLARLGNAAIAYVGYLQQMIWPADLALLYPHPGEDLSTWRMLASVVVLAGVTIAVVRCRRRFPYLAVGWAWYLGMLVPVIGLVQVGRQSMADRYTYLPHIGIYLAVAWLAVDISVARLGARRVAGVAVAIVAVLAVAASRQTSYWRDSETLWRRTLTCTTKNAVAECHFGLALMEQNKLDAAIEHFRSAIEIDTDFLPARLNLGEALRRLGRTDEAIACFRQVLRTQPGSAMAHYNLGEAFRQRGNLDEAVVHLRRSLEIEPQRVDVLTNLGITFAQKGDVSKAIELLKQAMRLDPRCAETCNSVGAVLASQGKWEEAIEFYRQALQIKPEYAEAHNNLGFALATRGNWSQATEEYRRALAAMPHYAKARFNLAESLIRQQRYVEAIAEWQQMNAAFPDNPELLHRLAKAYAAGAMYPSAVEAGRQALEFARRQQNLSLVKAIEVDLQNWISRKR